MRHIHGQDHVQQELNKARLKSPLLMAVALIALVVMLISLSKRDIPVAVVCAAILLIAISLMGMSFRQSGLKGIVRNLKASDEVGRLQAGVAGERAVAETLQALDQNWVLFSGVVLDGMYGDLDHVLVGPSGIFAIEVKNWSGTIHYDGKTNLWTRVKLHGETEVAKDPAHQVIGTSALLHKTLGRAVRACVVFSHPHSVVSGDKYPDVMILTLQSLLPWLRRQATVLSTPEIAQVEKTLRARMRS